MTGLRRTKKCRFSALEVQLELELEEHCSLAGSGSDAGT